MPLAQLIAASPTTGDQCRSLVIVTYWAGLTITAKHSFFSPKHLSFMYFALYI